MSTEPYEVDLVTDDGETVQVLTLTPEQTSVDVQVTGVGTITYSLYYYNAETQQKELVGSKTVNFTGNG